jgi:hypothetical protein
MERLLTVDKDTQKMVAGRAIKNPVGRTGFFDDSAFVSS